MIDNRSSAADRMKVAVKREAKIWQFIVPMLAIYVAFVSPITHVISESRVWRDLTMQTPFSSVEITRVTATSLELEAYGSMVKGRDCRTFGAPIAQVLVDGILLPAQFISREGEATPQSRAADPRRQAFGPWVIVSPVPWPDRAVMYRQHLCDEKVQTNKVFDIPRPKER